MALQFNVQKAKAAGYNDQQIQQMIAAGPPKEMLATQQPTQSQSDQPAPLAHPLLASLLPIGGSIVGGIGGAALGGPVGGVAGAAGGGSIGEWLSELLNGQKMNPGDIVKQGALGAGGEVTGLGIGRLFGPVAKGAEEALSRSVINPTVKAGVGGAQKEVQLLKTADELLKGPSAKAYYDQLQPAMDKLTAQINDKLAGNTETIKTQDMLDMVDNALKNNINYNENTKTFKNVYNDLENMIINQANKNGENGTTLNRADAFKIKQAFGEKLGKAFGKENLTPAEDAGVSAWKALQNAMPKSIQDLTSKQHDLFDLASGLKASRGKQFRLPIIGPVPGVERPIQAAQTKLADILSSSKLRSTVPRVAGQGVSQALFGGQVPSLASGTSSTTDNQTMPDTASPTSTQSPTSNPDMLKQLALLDLLQNRGKNLSSIIALSNFINPPNSKPTAQSAGLVNSGIQNATDALRMYKNDPTLLTKQVIPGQFFSRQFDSALYDATDALLRLRTGAQANPSEIRGYMNKIGPTIGDSPAVVDYKMNKLISDLQAYSNNQGSSTGGLDINSLFNFAQ